MGDYIESLTPEELLEKYSQLVYRLAYSRTQNVHDAQDITQDVFLKYIKSGVKFESEEHRKAWFIRVTVNTGKSFVTSAWFRHRAEPDEQAGEPFETIPEKSEIYYAVRELPPKYRDIVHLYYYEELSVAQICSVLGIKDSTAKSLLHRARALLKEKLKGEYYEL